MLKHEKDQAITEKQKTTKLLRTKSLGYFMDCVL